MLESFLELHEGAGVQPVALEHDCIGMWGMVDHGPVLPPSDATGSGRAGVQPSSRLFGQTIASPVSRGEGNFLHQSSAGLEELRQCCWAANQSDLRFAFPA